MVSWTSSTPRRKSSPPLPPLRDPHSTPPGAGALWKPFIQYQIVFPTTNCPCLPYHVNSAKAIWDFEGISCSSRHIPHVKFAGLIHPGILGCAPSAEVLATWNKREGELIAASKLEGRDVALPPLAKSAHAGSADEALAEKIGNEGARTVPGRPEHGGNCE